MSATDLRSMSNEEYVQYMARGDRIRLIGWTVVIALLGALSIAVFA